MLKTIKKKFLHKISFFQEYYQTSIHTIGEYDIMSFTSNASQGLNTKVHIPKGKIKH